MPTFVHQSPSRPQFFIFPRQGVVPTQLLIYLTNQIPPLVLYISSSIALHGSLALSHQEPVVRVYRQAAFRNDFQRHCISIDQIPVRYYTELGLRLR